MRDTVIDKAVEAAGIGPSEYRSEWTWIKEYPAQNESGGAVRVYVSCLPARFYRIDCGDIVLNTGTGVEQLVHDIAFALSEDALGFASVEEMIP